MTSTQLRSLFALTRPELSLSAGICVVLGQILAAGMAPPFIIMLAGFWSVFCISAAILVMNDVLDYHTDCINAPHRPLPSGAISPQLAKYASLGLFITGLLLSSILSLLSLLAAIKLSCIGALYNWKLKKSGLIGNLLVSFSVGMTFVYGGISTGYLLEKRVLFFAVLTALVDLGEEICADAMDVTGDAHTGSRSLAVLYSPQFALKTGSIIFLIVVLTTIIPFTLGWFKPVFIIPLAVMDGVILYAVRKILSSFDGRCRNYLSWIYRSGSIALLLFVIMLLAGL